MSIEVHCPNGHILRVADEHAGKHARCPACKTVVLVRGRAPPPEPQPSPAAPEETVQVRCPNDHVLRVSIAWKGKQVRCPACQVVFTAELPPAHSEEVDEPPPEDEQAIDEHRPRKKGRRSRRAARRARKLGLKIVGIGLLLNALAVIAAITAVGLIMGSGIALIAAGMMAKQGERPTTMAAAVTILVFIGVGLAVLSPILGGLGKVLCCWVPRAAHGRGLVITSIVCDFAQFIVPILAVLVGISGALVEGGRFMWGAMFAQLALNFLAISLWLTSMIMFLMFLARVAEFVGEEGYAEDARNLMKWAVFIGVTPIVMVVLLAIPFCGSCFSLILSLALLVVAVLFIISYLRLLFGLRAVVS